MAQHKLLQRLRENALSLTLFTFFFVFLIGVSVSGHRFENEELAEHSQPAISYTEYVTSGNFVEAVFENWESEFLQMGALVVLTIFLRQKGSADSKKLRGKEMVDTSSRYSIIHASSWRNRGRAFKDVLYGNSLSLALFALFAASFVLHAAGGASAANEEAALHNGEQVSVVQYIATSQFWFESFQNWQSEFLAVGALLVLSIFLRQRGSPESKVIGEPNSQTGRD
jgi:hypothetical protein